MSIPLPQFDGASFERALRLGVIGVGTMGRYHARILADLDGVELVAVADPSEAALTAVCRGRTLRGYRDYLAMLDSEHPDAVTIAAPTSLHREIASEVIARGIHLLVEKPIAASLHEAQSIVDNATAAGVTLMVGHIERHNSAVVELQRQLGAGALGRIFEIKTRRTGPFPARIRDAGVALDLATHDLDLMLLLTGSEIVRLYAETERKLHSLHEDMLSGLLRFADGTVGHLDISRLSPVKTRDMAVLGERGMFVLDFLTQHLTYYENGSTEPGWAELGRLTGVTEGRMVRLVTEQTEPLRNELLAFVNAIRDGAETGATGIDGLRALAAAEALLESARTEQVIQGLGLVGITAGDRAADALRL